MKNQLLEDLDDSQSRLPAPPPCRAQAAPPPRALPKGRRAGVWRAREATRPPPDDVQPPAPPPAPRIEAELGAFSSRAPDWAMPLPPDDPPWADRWGRKALGWTAGLGVALALAATGVWMVRDTQVESTLAVVADHTPAVIPDPVVEQPPALRMLPPEPAPAAPVLAPALAPAPPPPIRQPEATPVPERRLAAATPVKRSRPVVKKTAPKPKRERVLVRAAPASRPITRPITRPAPPPEPPAAESPLSETLRLCRAAGYHATACIKRGCEATRFGLACRG